MPELNLFLTFIKSGNFLENVLLAHVDKRLFKADVCTFSTFDDI